MDTLNIEDFKRTGRAMGYVTPAAYHAAKGVLQNCVSKSTLTEFARNPYRFQWNKENGVAKTSTGFRFGSLVDALVLTPDLFHTLYRVEAVKVATKKDGTPYANGQQDRDQKAEWEALAAAGLTVISPEEYDKAAFCAADVTRELARKGLKLGETFDSQVGFMFHLEIPTADGEREPINFMGMIDILPRDPELPIIDLKTTSAQVDDKLAIDRSIRGFSYGIQAAAYSDMLAQISGVQRDFSFFFVESVPPHCMASVTMRRDALDLYRKKYWKQLAHFAECCHTGIWDGKIQDPRDYVPTPYEEFED